MKEMNQPYDAKMQKTIEVVMSDFAWRPGLAGPTPGCWTRSPWSTTAPKPPSTRWPPSPPLTPVPW